LAVRGASNALRCPSDFDRHLHTKLMMLEPVVFDRTFATK